MQRLAVSFQFKFPDVKAEIKFEFNKFPAQIETSVPVSALFHLVGSSALGHC